MNKPGSEQISRLGEQNALLADSQRGSGPKEKADAGVVKEEEYASVSTAEDSKMTSGARGFDLGGNMPAMPRLGGFASKFLRGLGLVLLLILLFASVVSVPTGHVGVLTLFGRVTGETLGEGMHVINPLKSVQRERGEAFDPDAVTYSLT